MNELEIIRNIKMEIIRKRREIETMKNGERKKKAWKVYAELLRNLVNGTLSVNKGHASTKQRRLRF